VVRTGERELENRIRWKKTKGERGMEGEKRKEAGSACLFEKFLQYNPDSKQTNKQTQLKQYLTCRQSPGATYEGRSINKLQNGVIMLIFKL